MRILPDEPRYIARLLYPIDTRGGREEGIKVSL